MGENRCSQPSSKHLEFSTHKNAAFYAFAQKIKNATRAFQ
jgi:hypothetical protein